MLLTTGCRPRLDARARLAVSAGERRNISRVVTRDPEIEIARAAAVLSGRFHVFIK